MPVDLKKLSQLVDDADGGLNSVALAAGISRTRLKGLLAGKAESPRISTIDRIAGGGKVILVWILLVAYWFFDGYRKLKLPTDEELDEQRKIQEDEHNRRIESQLDILDERLEKAENAISSQGPRSLSADQRAAIKNTLKPFQGQTITVTTLMSDVEGATYAQSFISAFREAGWEVTGQYTTALSPDFENSIIAINKAQNESGQYPPSLLALIRCLMDLKLTNSDGKIHLADDIKAGEIKLEIAPRSAKAQY